MQNVLTGSDTIMVALTWTFSLLLNNAYVLKMVQEELNIHIEKDSEVKESDVKYFV